MNTKEFISRLDFAILKGQSAMHQRIDSNIGGDYVSSGLYAGFRTSSLSAISSITGKESVYYEEFDKQVNNSYVYNI